MNPTVTIYGTSSTRKYQQRIEQYFSSTKSSKSQPKHKLSFLDLPAPVRKRIYSAAGLIAEPQDEWGPIGMNYGCVVDRDRNCQFEPESTVRECLKCSSHEYRHFHCNCTFPLGLLTVCRAISDEATHLFYSQGRFEILYTAPGKLSALERLSPKAIASLRHLTIWLNISLCPNGPSCKNPSHAGDCHPGCRIVGHDPPLSWSPKSRDIENLLSSFRRVCSRLSQYLRPGNLNLTFNCESMDYDIVDNILASLKMLPTLHACSISLSRKFDPRLREMAVETRLGLLDHPESPILRYFPLRNLPRELELRVFSLTDLVAPSHLWHAKSSYGNYKSSWWGGRQCIYPDYSARKLADLEELPDIFCCCEFDAHSLSSSPCSHWHFPDALFLVDRRMTEDVRTIINRENNWILPFDSLERTPPVLPAPPRSFWHFIENVRNLTIDFWSTPDSSLIRVDSLVRTCAVERIRLVLQLRHPRHERRNDVSDDPASPMWEEHCKIVKRFAAALAGRKFRDFFVRINPHHVEWDEYSGPYQVNCGFSTETLDEINSWLERQVVETSIDIDRRTRLLEKRVCKPEYDDRCYGVHCGEFF